MASPMFVRQMIGLVGGQMKRRPIRADVPHAEARAVTVGVQGWEYQWHTPGRSLLCNRSIFRAVESTIGCDVVVSAQPM